MKLGAMLGDQIRVRNKKRRNIAKVNIDLCFPTLSDAEKEKMLQDHFQNYGRGLLDMGLIMMATKERIERFSHVVGAENFDSLGADQNIILITYHTTTLDMCSSSMLADRKLVSMMKRDKNPVLNWFLYRARTRYKNARVFMRDESLLGIIKGMNEGRMCYLIPDEDFGDGKHTVFAPFFGQTRATLNVVSRMAKIANAVVIPSICRLVPETGRYVTTVSPPIENFPRGDWVADATAINQAMEKLIMQAPDQYMWTFRWFKTQPRDLPNPYDIQ